MSTTHPYVVQQCLSRLLKKKKLKSNSGTVRHAMFCGFVKTSFLVNEKARIINHVEGACTCVEINQAINNERKYQKYLPLHHAPGLIKDIFSPDALTPPSGSYFSSLSLET
jgi:hypothetical protein